MEPGKTSGNIAFKPICNAELQESQDEEIINLGEKPGIQGWISIFRGCQLWNTGSCSDCAFEGSKERGKFTLRYQEEISLENNKFEWLIKHEENEDLNFFMSLVPYMKQLPPIKKSYSWGHSSNTWRKMRSVHYKIICFTFSSQVWTILTAGDLQNRTVLVCCQK